MRRLRDHSSSRGDGDERELRKAAAIAASSADTMPADAAHAARATRGAWNTGRLREDAARAVGGADAARFAVCLARLLAHGLAQDRIAPLGLAADIGDQAGRASHKAGQVRAGLAARPTISTNPAECRASNCTGVAATSCDGISALATDSCHHGQGEGPARLARCVLDRLQ
jgi:hypothetical protein